MTRVYVLVEGQTEEAFINELMLEHYAHQQLYLYPVIVTTSPGHRGGVVSYAKVRPQIERLCKQHPTAWVTTMFDLYALPADFPGKSNGKYPAFPSGRDKAEFLEMALSKDIAQANYIPNLLVHEFEALLFSSVSAFEEWTDNDDVLKPLRTISAITAPEDINDSPATAPSKRILAAMTDYQKTVHGPLIACAIGLDAIRAACPHFDAWLNKIEDLS
ncbi:DUF4276 family protein [Agrobacterium vitis]|uniref:DUF4276 family protein n=1 Tax=Agrobacterium vitis TaxID=373 RepID=UPI0012E87B4D|nr:DUF4276 family protein [Agrobacterium vitis]MVA24453.1 DUF4276 family protein [Agrobacterium vitis]